MLRAAGIFKTLGGRVVLRGADIELRGGESVSLEGANGAGKTTLLKTLAGLLRPDSCASFEVEGERGTNWRRWGGGGLCSPDAAFVFDDGAGEC